MKPWTRLSRYREQFLYGQTEILQEFCRRSGQLILGRLQHGFDPRFSDPARPFRPYGLFERPQYVWSGINEQKGRERGVKSVRAVGAPWLYMLLLPKVLRRVAELQDTYVLLMPKHRKAEASPAHHEEFLAKVGTVFSSRQLVACLHGFDFMTESIQDVYRRSGVGVVSAGWPMLLGTPYTASAPICDRVNYLPNLLSFMSHSELIVTDFVGTHTLYAASLGVPSVFIPPDKRGAPLALDWFSRRSRTTDEASFMARGVRAMRISPSEQLLVDGLGLDRVMESRELNSLLEWHA